MEWIDYLGGIANRKIVVNGLQGDKLLSPAEKDALLAVFPTQYESLSFVQAGKTIHKDKKTLTTQFQSIYNKFTINPPTLEELAKLLRIGFDKLQKEELQQQESAKTNVLLKIVWRTDCEKQLNKQKDRLTSSPIQGLKKRKLDDVHVPLGVMKRKNKERPQFGNSQEILPEKGSESYQQGYTETKRIEHDDFLTEVGKREPGKHLVILGEPGAGKTTILTRIWQWLLDVHPEGQIIVAWVPLTAVKNDGLEDYLKKSWIKQFCKSDQIPIYWKSFEELADAGRVWLLLDGADEMGGDALGKIKDALNEKWAESIKAIVTCRLNLWDASPTNSLASSQDFQIYRTLDFKYDSPAGDEVEKFIDKWFENQPATGKKLRSALEEEGKERIKDLVQNPLRLTLLCDIWEEKNELPDTQANLYRRFVDYVYKFKADEFPNAYNLRRSLDRAMGVLAKQGINKANLRFRFNREELDESLPDIEHYDALTKLGWLNYLGKDEDAQEVYTFFHPTFQEYFAACNIPDWDYFLPSKHSDEPTPCQGEDVPTYRVFEKQWQQVIVFWIGRDFNNERKEEFLVKLTNFRDETSAFYYYQAYCIAAVCVGEFQSSRHAESIVQTIVKWAFGFFDPVQQAWVNLELVNSTLVSTVLLLTQREHLIKFLLPLIFQNDLPYDATLRMDSILKRLHAISVLGKTAKDNTKVIEDLTSFIYKTDSYLLRITAAEALGTIDVGSRLAITVIITFLFQSGLGDYNVLFFAAQCLGRISIGNELVIQELLNILSQLRNTDDSGQSIIVNTLSTIAVGHMETLAVLISMFQSNPDFFLLTELSDALVKIASNNECAVRIVKSNLSQPNQNKDVEPFVLRILRDINSSNQRENISLHNLFSDPTIDFQYKKEVLDDIEVGDEQSTKELSDIILSSNLDNLRLFLVADTLGRIDVGNKLAITTLLTIVYESDLGDYLLLNVLYSLRKIAVNDRDAIKMLMEFISKPNLSNILKCSVADTLWHIDIDKNKAMNTLLDIFSQSEWDDSLPMGTGESLNEIINIKMMPMVVNKLKNQVTTDMCESNYKKFYICKTVIWKCAQFLPYHEFHAAWHQS